MRTVLLVTSAITLGACGFADVVTGSELEAVKALRKGGEIVVGPELTTLRAIRSGVTEAVKVEELQRLRHDADLGRSVGRYTHFRVGFRTWRLDSATGESCILLTSDLDWKNDKTQLQGCGAN